MEFHDDTNFESTSQEEPARYEDIPTHFFVELTSLDELTFTANSTKRVKYTCVASTSRCLFLGTSTGTVYIFSRYAAKSRSRTHSPIPVHVFTTRDGQINTISISPSENLIAVGGDSGRVSVAQLNNGQSPTLLYTAPGDARAPDKVTALSWSNDHKLIYSGHSSGNLLVHRLTSRSVFRVSHQKLSTFGGEITQLDIYKENLVVATTTAAFLCNADSGECQQIGKKCRSIPSVLGARYVRTEDDCYIVAARPNGRIWESNLLGVVYKTHQFRQSSKIPRAPPVSFRNSFPPNVSQFEGIHPENQDVMFGIVEVTKIDTKNVIISVIGSRIIVADTDSSKILILTELESEILDFSICSSDVFVLLSDSKGLRKFSIFDRKKTVEKLNLKHLFIQSSQVIIFSRHCGVYSPDLIMKTIDGLEGMTKKRETEKLIQELHAILKDIDEKRKTVESTYDNLKKEKNRVNLSEKLETGVHRVLKNVQQSGYDDDFSFKMPQALRERSRSSPCSTKEDEVIAGQITKRASEPSTIEMKEEWRKNGTPDVVEEDILNRARMLLDADGCIIGKESLRTLLQLEGIQRDEIRFTPTVTIGNAAKALAEMVFSVPVDLSTIWRNSEMDDENDEESKNVAKKLNLERKKTATIVKVVCPGVRPKYITSKTEIEKSKVIEEEMRRKQVDVWLDLKLSHMKHQNLEQDVKTEVEQSDTESTLATEITDITPINEHLMLTKTEAQIMNESCASCRMHRSWSALALLTTVCGRADIIKEIFSNGGVPSNSEQWSMVLRHVVEQEETNIDSICPRCETALSGVEKVVAEGWRDFKLIDDGKKPNAEKIFEWCKQLENEKLKLIMSRKSVTGLDSYAKKNRPSSIFPEAIVKQNVEIFDKNIWKWTKGVKLKTILSLAVFCIGKKKIIDILTKDDRYLAKCMNTDDWCALIIMISRENCFSSSIRIKTIVNVLKSVGANVWIDPLETFRNKTTLTSWIVDSLSKCPICRLAVKVPVGGTENGSRSYTCGHLYHEMCLTRRFSTSCLACRVKARQDVRRSIASKHLSVADSRIKL